MLTTVAYVVVFSLHKLAAGRVARLRTRITGRKRMLTTECHWMEALPLGGVLIRDGDGNDMLRAIASGLLSKSSQNEENQTKTFQFNADSHG